ncbi:hypothetical protein HK098_004986 [Nowakowskiella sp. JEL0407]|nr:hypothetical protein HK098_004986 [Nowakowskiella sp. JEL0407]
METEKYKLELVDLDFAVSHDSKFAQDKENLLGEILLQLPKSSIATFTLDRTQFRKSLVETELAGFCIENWPKTTLDEFERQTLMRKSQKHLSIQSNVSNFEQLREDAQVSFLFVAQTEVNNLELERSENHIPTSPQQSQSAAVNNVEDFASDPKSISSSTRPISSILNSVRQQLLYPLKNLTLPRPKPENGTKSKKLTEISSRINDSKFVNFFRSLPRIRSNPIDDHDQPICNSHRVRFSEDMFPDSRSISSSSASFSSTSPVSKGILVREKSKTNKPRVSFNIAQPENTRSKQLLRPHEIFYNERMRFNEEGFVVTPPSDSTSSSIYSFSESSSSVDADEAIAIEEEKEEPKAYLKGSTKLERAKSWPPRRT